MTPQQKIRDALEDIEIAPIETTEHPSAPVKLMLHRFPVPDGRPVLLLHGASAGSDTFFTPRGDPETPRNLMDYLAKVGFEPWLLDWRASKFVTDPIFYPEEGKAYVNPELFDFNQAAQYDIAAAIKVIRKHTGVERIDAIGHCMGGAILAEALFKQVPGVYDRLSHVVLLTIGLFYQMNLHGRLKAEAHLLKSVSSDPSLPRFIDPRIKGEDLTRRDRAWPPEIEALYRVWPHPYDRARIEREKIPSADHEALEVFNRLSFMFGEPYQEGNLVPEIHHALTKMTVELDDDARRALPAGTMIEVKAGTQTKARGDLAYTAEGEGTIDLALCRCDGPFGEKDTVLADGQTLGSVEKKHEPEPPLLPTLFGAMPLYLYQHAAENLRSGVATKLGENPVSILEASEIEEGANAYQGFDALDRLTLIGGGLNRLWHRDCIDRMADWLGRNPRRRPNAWNKRIFLDYGHQDLLWGKNAATDVFPEIVKGLSKAEEPDQTEVVSTRPETAA